MKRRIFISYDFFFLLRKTCIFCVYLLWKMLCLWKKGKWGKEGRKEERSVMSGVVVFADLELSETGREYEYLSKSSS